MSSETPHVTGEGWGGEGSGKKWGFVKRHGKAANRRCGKMLTLGSTKLITSKTIQSGQALKKQNKKVDLKMGNS